MGICVCVLFLLTSCIPTQTVENTPSTLTEPESNLSTEKDTQPTSTEIYAWPPYIYVNDTLYRWYIAAMHESLNNDFTYLGTIDSDVPQNEEPTENFQTNRDKFLGAEVYQSGNYLIIVYDGYYVYFYLEADIDNATIYALRNKEPNHEK